MAEGGLAGLTVEGTATRAGVAKTTVYRRYPTKLDLAVAAVAALLDNQNKDNAQDSVADDAMSSFGDVLGSPAAQAALLAVAAAAAASPQVHEQFSSIVLQPALDRVTASLSELQKSGDASEALDAGFYYDVLVGTLLHRLVIRREAADKNFHDDLATLIAFMLKGMPD